MRYSFSLMIMLLVFMMGFLLWVTPIAEANDQFADPVGVKCDAGGEFVTQNLNKEEISIQNEIGIQFDIAEDQCEVNMLRAGFVCLCCSFTNDILKHPVSPQGIFVNLNLCSDASVQFYTIV